MRKLIIILCFLYGTAQGQTLFPNLTPNVSSSTNYLKYGYLEAGTFIFTPRDTFPALYPSLIKHPNGKYYHTAGNGAPWAEFQSGSGGGGGGTFTFNGRSSPVTPLVGDYSSFYAPLSHSHTFASLTSKPTTLSGYGINDAALASHTHTFGSLTSRPSTISGYGITDAFTQSQADAIYSALGHTHAFAALTGKPTTLQGYGITDTVNIYLSSNLIGNGTSGNPLDINTTKVLSGTIVTGTNSVDKYYQTSVGGTTYYIRAFTTLP